MTMTPIHRIPQDGTIFPTLTQYIDAEGPFDDSPIRALHRELDSAPKDEHTSIMLDWAMQLRAETGRSWGECIRTAQIMYYG